MLLGTLGAYGIPTFFMTAAVWKSLMKVSRQKHTSINRAKELFPEQAHLFQSKKDHDRAEALLLATFGTRFYGFLGRKNIGLEERRDIDGEWRRYWSK